MRYDCTLSTTTVKAAKYELLFVAGVACSLRPE
jgi:hypothetical protein